MTDNWTIVLTSPQLIDEARQAPDEQLSFMAAADLVSISQRLFIRHCPAEWLSVACTSSFILQSIQNEYTIGESNMSNPYHINIIKSQLRRNLGDMFGDLRDEIAHSFEDTIPTNGHGVYLSLCFYSVPLLRGLFRMGESPHLRGHPGYCLPF